MVARSNLRRDHRPLGDERFAVHQLEHENEGVHQDDENSDDGNARRSPGRIA